MPELINRPRRLRATPALRDLVAEARLDARMLVQPHFVVPGDGIAEPIDAMPGIEHQSVDRLTETVAHDLELGIRSVLLFGLPPEGAKAPDGHAAWADDAVVSRAVAALKQRFGAELAVMTDVCLCAYTDHGHCGVVRDGRIVNDETLPLLAEMALAHARAGADVVAPSDMMDGRVGAIRDALDDAGLVETAIMSYSVKYASAYYGPFREAAHSAPSTGDRRSYQMDARNRREALARGRPRRRRGRRHPDGQAGARLPRRGPRPARGLPPPARRLQRLRRVLDGQGRGRQGLGRRARRRARELARLPTRRRRHPDHLPRPRGARGGVAVSAAGPRSSELYRRAGELMPAGVNSPVRAFRSVGGEPLFYASGPGCHFIDADGRRFVDYVGSWGPLILGHAHPAVVEAVCEAAATRALLRRALRGRGRARRAGGRRGALPRDGALRLLRAPRR